MKYTIVLAGCWCILNCICKVSDSIMYVSVVCDKMHGRHVVKAVKATVGKVQCYHSLIVFCSVITVL